MEIKPLKKFDKIVTPAPDKSITHRAVMLNAVAEGRAVIKNALLGEDCLSTINCMRALGARIEIQGDTVTVEGASELKSPAFLDVGNSGTTMRLLSGLLAGREGEFVLDGDSSIRRRPMKRIIEPLSAMNADISGADGMRAPLKIVGKKLSGISYDMPVASAQVKSAILLAGLYADGATSVHEKTPSRNHTELMLKAMGADIRAADGFATVKKSRLKAVDVVVPGDISSAAYPMTLAACLAGARAVIKNVGVNPTRTGILSVFEQCGACFTLSGERCGAEKSADITVNYSPDMRPFNVSGELMPYLIDEIPALAVLACFIKGSSVISGAEELRVKESDRIETVVNSLKSMGADIEATDDGMIINGGKGLNGGAVIDPKGDHRIAMALSVAAALSRRGAIILDPECAFVSYPGFYRILEEEQ